ncbi:MAG TPA: hypothetical protein VH229_08130 [Candidatus Udaeobacter sp.]|jgi:hypothetical protein|nr:hypothetical protein [Candidatus Udaeobacter sp.]
MTSWRHLEKRFGSERPRKLLALDDEAMAVPVHLIACHRGATESQSLKHLGFPDATVVSTRSWVYVADEVQKIQIVFLANCRDETTTNLAIPGFFEWLAQVQEEMRLSARAAARSPDRAGDRPRSGRPAAGSRTRAQKIKAHPDFSDPIQQTQPS